MSKHSWYLQVFLMELRKLIAYRVDFWINFLGQTIVSVLVAFFLWKSIFSYAQSDTLKGHNIEYMIFYYITVPLIFRIEQGQGIGFFSREIYEGSLNKYLLYPINVFHYKLLTYFANSIFFIFQLFIILTIYNTFFYSPEIFHFSISSTLMFLVSLLMGTLTFYYLFISGELLAFWFDNTWSLGVILRFLTSFLGGALIPLDFYPDWARKLLDLTPFPYLLNFPLQSLTGNITTPLFFKNLLICTIWLIFFRTLSTFIWNKGQYKYSGVGI